MTVLYFTSTAARATAMQRDHDPEVMRCLPIGAHTAYRASAIIVEQPFRERQPSPLEISAWEEWVAWLPTRLVPGINRRRITFL